MSNRFRSMKVKPTIGGGYIVIRRGDRRGDLCAHSRPFEHASLEAALKEAQRLANHHNREFVVFQQAASARPLISETEDVHAAKQEAA